MARASWYLSFPFFDFSSYGLFAFVFLFGRLISVQSWGFWEVLCREGAFIDLEGIGDKKRWWRRMFFWTWVRIG